MKNIFNKSLIGTVIFFCLNAFIIGGFLYVVGFDSILMILVVYVFSIAIAFSPFGEWMLGFMVGARKMTRADMQMRITPLLKSVYKKAKKKTPKLTMKIIVKIMYKPEPNAYAIGRKTICVTEGLFRLPDDVICGI
jgi:heat shock protein HtpX